MPRRRHRHDADDALDKIDETTIDPLVVRFRVHAVRQSFVSKHVKSRTNTAQHVRAEPPVPRT
jgi:hypothetical protein